MLERGDVFADEAGLVPAFSLVDERGCSAVLDVADVGVVDGGLPALLAFVFFTFACEVSLFVRGGSRVDLDEDVVEFVFETPAFAVGPPATVPAIGGVEFDDETP